MTTILRHGLADMPGRTAPAAFDLHQLQHLDPGSAMPLYMQLAERLAAPIYDRHAALVGHALPTELQCMEHFGVSRPTVRQAMAHLVSIGLVARGRGRGTFIAPQRLNHDVSLAFEDEMRAARKTRSASKCCGARPLARPPPPCSRRTLGISPDRREGRADRAPALPGRRTLRP